MSAEDQHLQPLLLSFVHSTPGAELILGGRGGGGGGCGRAVIWWSWRSAEDAQLAVRRSRELFLALMTTYSSTHEARIFPARRCIQLLPLDAPLVDVGLPLLQLPGAACRPPPALVMLDASFPLGNKEVAALAGGGVVARVGGSGEDLLQSWGWSHALSLLCELGCKQVQQQQQQQAF
jgi:hypothetical protein